MKASEIYHGKYMSAKEFADGESRNLTISCVTEETMKQRDGKSIVKLVLWFEPLTSQGLVLNTLLARKMILRYGDETLNWHGQRIDVYRTTVDFGGDEVPALRIR